MSMISVIMPAYNEEKYIGRAIDSILAQSFQDFELIVINDIGSNDGTVDIVEEYVRKDKRVRLLQKTDGARGIAASLNMGLCVARGEYIARMDADDYSYPLRFEKQLDFLIQNTNVVLCGTDYRLIEPQKIRIVHMESNPERNKCLLLFGTVVAHPTVMFRKNFFLKHNLLYNDQEMVEDYELWCRVAEWGDISNVSEVLLDYTYGFGNNVSAKENVPFNYRAADVSRQNIARMLQIEVDRYPKDVFALRYVDDISYVEHAADFLRLLCDMSRKNSIYNAYEKRELSNILIDKWNSFYYKCPVLSLLSIKDDFLEQIMTRYITEESAINKLIYDCQQLKIISKSFKKIIIWGVGINLKDYINKFENYIEEKVICFIDKDEKLAGKSRYNKIVYPPNELLNFDYDAILISSNKYFMEIKNSIIEYVGGDYLHIYPIGMLNFLDE